MAQKKLSFETDDCNEYDNQNTNETKQKTKGEEASFTVGYRRTRPGGTRGSSPPKNKKLPCIASRLLCEVGAALQRAAELGHVRRAPEATRADLGDSENLGEILTSPVRS